MRCSMPLNGDLGRRRIHYEKQNYSFHHRFFAAKWYAVRSDGSHSQYVEVQEKATALFATMSIIILVYAIFVEEEGILIR